MESPKDEDLIKIRPLDSLRLFLRTFSLLPYATVRVNRARGMIDYHEIMNIRIPYQCGTKIYETNLILKRDMKCDILHTVDKHFKI